MSRQQRTRTIVLCNCGHTDSWHATGIHECLRDGCDCDRFNKTSAVIATPKRNR